MKLVHFSIVEGITKDANLDLNLSNLNELSQRMLLITLTLSCIHCHSALCMICSALQDFIVDVSLTLTGAISLLKTSKSKSVMVFVVTILNL